MRQQRFKTTTTDTNGNVIAYAYDSFGRTQSVLRQGLFLDEVAALEGKGR